MSPVKELPVSVTEKRHKELWRALPRNLQKVALALDADTESPWHPHYEDFDDWGRTIGLRCWKCCQSVQGWYPALEKLKPKSRQARLVMVRARVTPDSPDQLLPAVRLIDHNHKRIGRFHYQRQDGVFGNFEYIHCADCGITDADGEILLSILLAGLDLNREANAWIRERQDPNDDEHAFFMSRFSGATLLEKVGKSVGPIEMAQGLGG